MRLLLILLPLMLGITLSAQTPPLEEGGVSQELAKWRAVQYSNVSYKINLTLEKMSPVLKGTIEIHVTQAAYACAQPDCPPLYIVLDWRKMAGHEKDSTVSNVEINGTKVQTLSFSSFSPAVIQPEGHTPSFFEHNEHLIFHDGVRMGENVIKLDFTSPILTSGSAITRYIDKEDGSEYIYSLFVPSDASTAFPVFDQPDLKARFSLSGWATEGWNVISNTPRTPTGIADCVTIGQPDPRGCLQPFAFAETKPISTYVFAFTAGPWQQFSDSVSETKTTSWFSGGLPPADRATTSNGQWNKTNADINGGPSDETVAGATASGGSPTLNRDGGENTVGRQAGGGERHVYVRKSQGAKFQPHAAETFRLTREGINYLETYFDYKFPWPKYDLVLIPEFPFGGMEHAGATFLRESSVIFPTEPTKGDYISRANLIFHETAHQWFGDTVTMRWFDDLWLKEGFAEFMAYKTLEKVMPEANAWKVFYERNKQAAYATDSTRGTTPIYQPIKNLSSAKSAYGNIVYRKAPSFLRQAEFYLGEDKFQTAVRAFLKKHGFANAGWEDLVKEFERGSGKDLNRWALDWITKPGVPKIRIDAYGFVADGKMISTGRPTTQSADSFFLRPVDWGVTDGQLDQKVTALVRSSNGKSEIVETSISRSKEKPDFIAHYTFDSEKQLRTDQPDLILPNYLDHAYGIFLPGRFSEYITKHIQEEKDPFLRSMMWGALWDSVREAELDPREYVELAIKQLSVQSAGFSPSGRSPKSPTGAQAEGCTANCGETDETTIQSLLGRVSTALNYYIDADAGGGRSFPGSLKGTNPSSSEGAQRDPPSNSRTLPTGRVSALQADLRSRFEAILVDRLQNTPTPGQRITFFRAFINNASTEQSRAVLKDMLRQGGNPSSSEGAQRNTPPNSRTLPTGRVSASGAALNLKTKDKFDIVTRLATLNDPDAPRLLADLEKTETSDDAKRYAYAAHAAFPTADNRAKFWNDFVNNKDISESWIEAAIGPFNSIRHPELSQPYLERALAELPNLKRTRKIFFVNNWLGAWLSGQRDQQALDIVNKFLTDHPQLDNDLRLKILENVDVIERAVKIRSKFGK